MALTGGSEPPTQLALAKEVSLDRTVMTHLLDDLEAHNLVTRKPDPRDRRARQVLITDTGHTRLTEVRHSLGAAEARLLTDLGPKDTEQLRICSRASHIPRSAKSSHPTKQSARRCHQKLLASWRRGHA
ncbi:MarR family winged helix-turn-helix transcriptional regulator [Streptomyces sp. NPDC051218]|uniref:MarR family winged helix-turn-helix transcriptional regulator n=1 Tax=Streptomyces sp. NPDC051218 TaxID=3365645 RepID=UPI0037BE10B8